MISRKKGSPRLLLILLLISTSRSSAQYNEQREYASSEARYITAGVVNLEFTPRGTNTQPDSLKIRFNRLMPMISFRQGPAEVLFGYSRYTLSGSSRSTIFFGGRFGTEFPITGRSSSALLFPLLLAADYTKAESAGPSKDDFNIASVGIGGGFKYRYAGSTMDVSIGVEQLVQYSSEGIGIGSGYSSSTLGDVVILLNDIAVFDGIAIGYRFRLQAWSMNESKLNYRSIWHGPYLGILF